MCRAACTFSHCRSAFKGAIRELKSEKEAPCATAQLALCSMDATSLADLPTAAVNTHNEMNDVGRHSRTEGTASVGEAPTIVRFTTPEVEVLFTGYLAFACLWSGYRR